MEGKNREAVLLVFKRNKGFASKSRKRQENRFSLKSVERNRALLTA